MGIEFLTGLLFSIVAFFVVYSVYDKKHKKSNKGTWFMVPLLFFVGMLLGVPLSIYVGGKISENYLAGQAPMIVLETSDLFPFSVSSGAYIVTGENKDGKKVAWYLQEEELFEKPYGDIIDRNMIVFTNATTPAKQSVRVNVGSFWEWFAVIPNAYRFVIPAGGLQKGEILKTYKFIPVYPE